jgi:hypothetical protein
MDVLNNDDDFFESLQQFRKLYADRFLTTPEVPPRTKSYKQKGIDLNVRTEEKNTAKVGYFRVNDQLEIVKQEYTFREMDEQVLEPYLMESEPPVKVSIPANVRFKTKQMKPKSTSDYREFDSMYLGDVILNNLVFA